MKPRESKRLRRHWTFRLSIEMHQRMMELCHVVDWPASLRKAIEEICEEVEQDAQEK